MSGLAWKARRAFYRWGGPWYRNRLFESLGSERYSYPALHGLDRALQRHLDWRGGVFIEAGAHDGYTQSNTYALERLRGWTGVLIEPVPRNAARARRRRRAQVFECALVGPDLDGTTVEIEAGDLMSTLAPEEGGSLGREHAAIGAEVSGTAQARISVPARTLSSVLDEAGITRVDLLALDVEGFELQALSGLDLERHRPTYMLVEMLDPEGMLPAFEDALGELYEVVEQPSVCDVLFGLRRRVVPTT